MGKWRSDGLPQTGGLLEFVKDQYRHCKPLLVLGAGDGLLEKARIPRALSSGKPDPGLLIASPSAGDMVDTFVQAVARHRHFEREADPPAV